MGREGAGREGAGRVWGERESGGSGREGAGREGGERERGGSGSEWTIGSERGSQEGVRREGERK